MLDDELLQDFMTSFYGYSDYAGDYWFVGMEEGGGDAFAEVERRLQLWDQRGRLELEDAAAYHAELGEVRWFGPRPRLQPTWNRLIRIALSAEGQDVQTEQVRAYQRDQLGRHGSPNCLLELLPLPSPSLGHWLYAQHSHLPALATREAYMRHYAAPRAEHLRQRIDQHKPKAVIFYSVNPNYLRWWQAIAGVTFTAQPVLGAPLHIAHHDHTVFVITYHPVAQGIRNDYFHQAGKLIAARAKTRAD